MRDLPYLTADLPGVSGRLKETPEDFLVEEIPAYEPSGEGEHLFLWIEKRDVAADQLVRHLARSLEVSRDDIGVAGLKDKRGVTRQFVSVPARAADRLEAANAEEVHVLSATRHTNKLRTGHLKGNRFSILLRTDSAPESLDAAQHIVERLKQLGVPNYYGEQRFGTGGETAVLGFDLLRGSKTVRDIPSAKRKFLLRLALQRRSGGTVQCGTCRSAYARGTPHRACRRCHAEGRHGRPLHDRGRSGRTGTRRCRRISDHRPDLWTKDVAAARRARRSRGEAAAGSRTRSDELCSLSKADGGDVESLLDRRLRTLRCCRGKGCYVSHSSFLPVRMRRSCCGRS